MLNSDTARSVIDHALYMGADFAELFIEKSQTNNIATKPAPTCHAFPCLDYQSS